MQIQYVKKSIFDVGATTLVNPVNPQGVMGAGLAKEFKKRYPDYFKLYKIWCKELAEELATLEEEDFGKIYTTYKGTPNIISAFTKRHWKHKSEYHYIDSFLKQFSCDIYCGRASDLIETIAIPKLGCGLGGLDWKRVKVLFDYHFRFGLPENTKVLVCV